MAIPEIVVGILALTLGRKLFWLFVGAAGFVAGIALAPQFLPRGPDWLVLVIALAAGLMGALLAVFVQSVAIGLAGFIGGGYIAISLLSLAGWDRGRVSWLAFVIGGIIGLILVTALFEYALMVLSSLIGAGLIVQAVDLRPLVAAVIFVLLASVGIALQAGLWRSSHHRSTPLVKT